MGVDGYARGWVGVVVADDGVKALFATTIRKIEEVGRGFGALAVMAIDIPIGLPDIGARQADVMALCVPDLSSAQVRAGCAASRVATAQDCWFPACHRRLETMMVDCADPFHLPRRDQCVRRATPTPAQRPGQGHRDPGSAPPAQRPPAAPGRPTGAVHPGGAGLPRRTGHLASAGNHTAVATAGQPRHHPTMAPRPPRPAARTTQPAQAPGQTAHTRLDPTAGRAPGTRESRMGLVRRVALRCIPGAAGRDSEGGSWVA